MLILIADAFDDRMPHRLARFGEVTSDLARLADAEVLLVRSKTKVRRDMIDAAPKLKLIIRGGVGLDSIDVEYARGRGIDVRNTADASTTAVAELTLGLMLALVSHIPRADASLRERQWLKKELERSELSGKTLGILGLGRIGLAVATRARAFQMRVLGYHPDVNFTDFAEIVGSREELLHESDFVSLHMPLVPATRGCINKKTLAQFRRGAFLVNTSRGEIIVEQDVADALRSGQLGGYACDVFTPEPPRDSPLFEAPNTVFTPHIGASTRENMERIGVVVERLLEAHSG
ncbi:MAG: hydroxyacid dehydrogenase [Acidobacteria bacterium]|nr:hydroxyacid dehydrogenase [Acidobacteriota bacterium]